MSLCGCGGEASPGKRFIKGHHMKGKKFSKKSIQKGRETRKINKEIREGKRPAPELPFCACGCGGRVTKPGNKYITGHNQRGKPSPMKGKKPWCTGLTKKTNNSLRESGKKISKTKKEFFVSDEGQQWLDEHNRGENSPRYGKKPWNYGKRNDTDMRVKKYGETTRKKYESKEIKVWCDGKTKEDEPRLMQLSESLLVFYQSDEGIVLKEKFSEDRKGEGNSFFNKEHTNEAKLEMKKKHSTDEAKQKHREFRKKQKFPKHHTNIEWRLLAFTFN